MYVENTLLSGYNARVRPKNERRRRIYRDGRYDFRGPCSIEVRMTAIFNEK